MKKSALIFTFLSLLLVFAVTTTIANSNEEVQTEQVISSDTPDGDCCGECTPENCHKWADCAGCESMEECMTKGKCSMEEMSDCKHSCTKGTNK